MDEFDRLLKLNENKTLYSLLEWISSYNSKTILVGIANTCDLYDQLDAKLQSRLGSNQIMFRPYTFQELLDILRKRLGSLSSMFEEGSLEILCQRIANTTSDVRKMCFMCEEAVRKAEDEYELLRINSGRENKILPIPIRIEHLKSVINISVTKSMLKGLSLSSKLLLGVLYSIQNLNIQTDCSIQFY